MSTPSGPPERRSPPSLIPEPPPLPIGACSCLPRKPDPDCLTHGDPASPALLDALRRDLREAHGLLVDALVDNGLSPKLQSRIRKYVNKA